MLCLIQNERSVDRTILQRALAEPVREQSEISDSGAHDVDLSIGAFD
jgi:hypothetical protein